MIGINKIRTNIQFKVSLERQQPLALVSLSLSGLTWIQLFGLVERAAGRRAQKVHLHLLPLKETVSKAKPPQESAERILATKALLNVHTQDSAGNRTWLISDGAKAYTGLTSKFGLKHGSCNHAKGQFVRKFRRGRQKLLLAHTGAIDSVWRLVKQQVPGSLSSTVKGSKANPRLMINGICQAMAMAFRPKKQTF